MSRLIDQDYARLETFIQTYQIKDLLDSRQRVQLIRRAHKHSLAAIQALSVIQTQVLSGSLPIRNALIQKESFCYDSLLESFSDLTSSMFASLQGLNKPAYMSLRSAIETFMRAIVGATSKEAETTTSVYRLFELAKECDSFKGSSTSHLNRLHVDYGTLCNHTHSASASHMIRNHAMSNFPKHDIEKLRSWVLIFERVSTSILTTLIFSNKRIYLDAHPFSRDVYDEVLSKEVRLFALGAN